MRGRPRSAEYGQECEFLPYAPPTVAIRIRGALRGYRNPASVSPFFLYHPPLPPLLPPLYTIVLSKARFSGPLGRSLGPIVGQDTAVGVDHCAFCPPPFSFSSSFPLSFSFSLQSNLPVDRVVRATRSPVAPAPTAIPSSWPAISIEGLIGTNSKLVCQVYLERSLGLLGTRGYVCVHTWNVWTCTWS